MFTLDYIFLFLTLNKTRSRRPLVRIDEKSII